MPWLTHCPFSPARQSWRRNACYPYDSARSKYHFNLVAANGQVIATSEAYEQKQSALHGIESVKQNAPGAEVDDQTGE